MHSGKPYRARACVVLVYGMHPAPRSGGSGWQGTCAHASSPEVRNSVRRLRRPTVISHPRGGRTTAQHAKRVGKKYSCFGHGGLVVRKKHGCFGHGGLVVRKKHGCNVFKKKCCFGHRWKLWPQGETELFCVVRGGLVTKTHTTVTGSACRPQGQQVHYQHNPRVPWLCTVK